MESKSTIRKAMLARRQALTIEEMAQAGDHACRQAKGLLADRATVLLYASFRGELDTLPLARWLEASGRSIALPITDRKNRLITPAQITRLGSLVRGAYGILEPAPGYYRELSPEQLDAVIVPGVCFDLRGYRIGYGGGYYDRFLPRLRQGCLTIGYGYSWQVVPFLEEDAWDHPLHCIVTDCQTHQVGSRT